MMNSSGLCKALDLPVADPPFATKCPLCGTLHKLEVTSWNRVVCRACGFFGTGIDLYAAKTGKELESAIADLVNHSVIINPSQEARKSFKEQADFRSFWKTITDRMLAAPSSVRGIVQARGLPFTDADLARLVPHVGCVQWQDISGLFPRRSGHSGRMGKWMWICIPSFSDCRVTGLWLFNKEDMFFAPLFDTEDNNDYGAGFGLIPSMSHRTTFVLPDPIDAFSVIMYHLADHQELPSVTFAIRAPINPSLDVTPGGLVFWPTEKVVDHYVTAMRTYRSSTCKYQSVSELIESKQTSMQSVLIDKTREAVSPVIAFVDYLMQLDQKVGREAVLAANLSDAEREPILLAAKTEQAKFVEELLTASQERATVQWDKYKIREEKDGWYMGNTVVSHAILYIESLRPNGQGDADVTGWVRYKKHRMPFTTKLTILRRKPGKWLHDFVLNKLGVSISVHPKLSAHLVDVALLFHQPAQAGMVQDWTTAERVLLPLFAVDARGVHPGTFEVEGPLLRPPTPLSVPEQGALTSRGYCELVLALAGNMVRVAKGLRPYGILAVNKPHMVQRVGAALSCVTVTSPELLPQHTSLPAIAQLDEHLLRQVFAMETTPHVLVSASRLTYHTAGLRQDWLRLEQDVPTEYRGLRLAILAVPKALANGVQPDTPTFYRDIAKAIYQILPGLTGKPALGAVSATMDAVAVARHDLLSHRLIDLMLAGQREYTSAVRTEDNYTVVDWDAITSVFKDSAVKLPRLEDVREILQDSRYLLQSRGRLLYLDTQLWDLHSRVVAVH